MSIEDIPLIGPMISPKEKFRPVAERGAEAMKGTVKSVRKVTGETVAGMPKIEFPKFPEPPPPPPPPPPPVPTSGKAAETVGQATKTARRRRRARLAVGRRQTILTGGEGALGGVAVKRLLGE